MSGAAGPGGGTAAVDGTLATGTDYGRRLFYEIEAKTHTWTQAEAVQHARTNDVIVALRSSYSPATVKAMVAANPQLKIYVYTNGTMAQTSQASTYSEDWYVKDPNGQKVRNDWNLILMNPANAGWAQDRARQCATFVASTTYHGCFLDNMGYGFLTYNWLSGVPINPATGKAWTNSAWISATAALADRVTRALAAPVMVNGLVDGALYFGSPASSILLTTSDAALAEVFLRTASQPAAQFPNSAAWKQDLDMLVAGARLGKPVVVTTKVWSGATAAELARWRSLAEATYLLGATEKSAFYFAGSRYASATTASGLDAVLGSAKGPYTVAGGAYIRQFVRGIAVVNPSTKAVSVPLPGRFKDAAGRTVTSLVLAPMTGAVLPAATTP